MQHGLHNKCAYNKAWGINKPVPDQWKNGKLTF